MIKTSIGLQDLRRKIYLKAYQKASDACKKTSWLWLEQME